jgi:beta-glucosidase
MNAPAGRLSATWYKKISDMVGAEIGPYPASYRYPVYDEGSNDNPGKLNGSIPPGILIYDIIKGKRTYQYYEGEPLYPFGYGLTYTRFEYSGLEVTGQDEKEVRVRVRVRNCGKHKSDEVVQMYGYYDRTQEREAVYEQARKRLLGFERIQEVGPGEQETVEMSIDLRDKLGVWDAGAGELWVEPGRYILEVGRSSDDPEAVKVRIEVGGKEKEPREMTGEAVMADSFEDYSHVGKVEIIHCRYDGGSAVRLEADLSWIKYLGGDFRSKPRVFTALVSAERDTEMTLYVGEPGNGGKKIKSISIKDTRPEKGISPGMGIGPGMSRDDPAFVNRPVWEKISEEVSGLEGVEDLYIETSRRGLGIGWFKFGQQRDRTEGIRFVSESGVYSIRKERGKLVMKAVLLPKTSMDEVRWSVWGIDGGGTGLAKITGEGVLEATGHGNGKVVVKAESGGVVSSCEILVTNQEERNKYPNGEGKESIEYLLFQTGVYITDSIIRRKGRLQNTLYYRAPEKEYDLVSYDVLPAGEAEWTVSGIDGSPASIAVIDRQGLLKATGLGDGKVKIKAVYRRNTDIYGERVIAIGNQGAKDAYRLIQGEHYDWRTAYEEEGEYLGPTPDTGSTFGPGSNEMGLYVAARGGDILKYENVEFGKGAVQFVIRLAAAGKVTIRLWVDGSDEANGGILIGMCHDVDTGKERLYKTFGTEVTGIQGRHDLYLVIEGKDVARINWFQFLPLT